MTDKQIEGCISSLLEYFGEDGKGDDPYVLHTYYDSYTASEMMKFIYDVIIEKKEAEYHGY